jgi:hypothetical protein
MTTTGSTQARDAAQLRQLIDDQMSAICAKGLDRIMNPYAADVVVFDVKPPFQTKGADAAADVGGVPALLPWLLPDRDARPQPHRQRRFGSCTLALAFHCNGKGPSSNADLDAKHRWLPEYSGQMADRSRARLRPIQSGDGSSCTHSRTSVEQMTTTATLDQALHLTRPAISVSGTSSPTHAGRAGEL